MHQQTPPWTLTKFSAPSLQSWSFLQLCLFIVKTLSSQVQDHILALSSNFPFWLLIQTPPFTDSPSQYAGIWDIWFKLWQFSSVGNNEVSKPVTQPITLQSIFSNNKTQTQSVINIHSSIQVQINDPDTQLIYQVQFNDPGWSFDESNWF